MDNIKRGYITNRQKELLVQFMEDNAEVLVGSKLDGRFTSKSIEALWVDISNKLNSIPGANKDWKQWKKTWQDIKKNSKAKAARIKKSQSETGGGPSTEEVLEDVDNQVINLMSKSQIDGHEEVVESNVDFLFDIQEVEMNNTLDSSRDEENYLKILKESTNHMSNDHDYKKPHKKLTKVKRLETSQNISKHLVGLTEKRALTQQEYNEKKLASLNEYRQFKKQVLQDNLNINKQILLELKDLKNILLSKNK